jgi:hypothetical protein
MIHASHNVDVRFECNLPHALRAKGESVGRHMSSANDALALEIEQLFDAIARRYGVRKLTAMMVMQSLEALFPMAEEHSKMLAVRALQGYSEGVDRAEFVQLAFRVRSSSFYSTDDVMMASRRERLRHEALPQQSLIAPPVDRFALEQELEAREQRIKELEAELFATQNANAQLQGARRRQVVPSTVAEAFPVRRPTSYDVLCQVAAARAAAHSGISSTVLALGSPSRQRRELHSTRRPPRSAAWYDDDGIISPTAAFVTQHDIRQYMTPARGMTTPSKYPSGLYQAAHSGQSPAPAAPSATPRSGSRFSAVKRIIELERNATSDAFGFRTL